MAVLLKSRENHSFMLFQRAQTHVRNVYSLLAALGQWLDSNLLSSRQSHTVMSSPTRGTRRHLYKHLLGKKKKTKQKLLSTEVSELQKTKFCKSCPVEQILRCSPYPPLPLPTCLKNQPEGKGAVSCDTLPNQK